MDDYTIIFVILQKCVTLRRHRKDSKYLTWNWIVMFILNETQSSPFWVYCSSYFPIFFPQDLTYINTVCLKSSLLGIWRNLRRGRSLLWLSEQHLLLDRAGHPISSPISSTDRSVISCPGKRGASLRPGRSSGLLLHPEMCPRDQPVGLGGAPLSREDTGAWVAEAWKACTMVHGGPRAGWAQKAALGCAGTVPAESAPKPRLHKWPQT